MFIFNSKCKCMQMLRHSFILFFIAVKKETYKKNNYTVACNDIICALLKITEISLLIQHFVEAAAVIVSGFFWIHLYHRSVKQGQ